MKRYLKDFNLTLEFVQMSIYECLDKQRWTRADTAWMLSEYAQIWQIENGKSFQSRKILARKIRETAFKDKTKLYYLVDFMCKKIFKEITEEKITLDPIKYEKRIDAGSLKEREIGISSMKQQCLDYIAVNACKPMFEAKIGHYQCASIKNKGQLFGKKAIETWIRTNPKKCRYIWKGDIRKFYNSVDHDILKRFLARDIKNKTVLYLLYTLIDTYKQGLCIGSYLCQFLANYLLSYAYHFVNEFLYVERRGKRIKLVWYVLFYMDDVFMTSSSKKNLKKAVKEFEKYLNEVLKLELKPTHQLFPLDSRPIDMMGYKIYTYKTTVRKRIFKKANRVFRKVSKQGYVSLKQARRIVSYYGYFKYSDSKKYLQKIKFENVINKSKEMISNDKRNNGKTARV